MALEHQDGTSQISAEELFSKFEWQPEDPVVDGKIKPLTLYGRLTPDNFERLIAKLAQQIGGQGIDQWLPQPLGCAAAASSR